MISLPGFPEAARALAGRMLEAAERDRELADIFKDAGRYVAALWAVHLHLSGGLTLPRLKEVCDSSGLLSRGRARTLLQFLRHLGYLDPASGGSGAARYVPTGPFLAAWTSHLRVALGAASLVEPAASLVLDRLHEPEVLESFARLHGGGLLQSARGKDQSAPYIRIFLHRLAGTQIVWILLSAGAETVFPPAEPVAVPVAATARRFGVSRIHVRRMLDDAAREGLVRLDPGGAVALTEPTGDYIRFLYAGQLVQLLAAAAGTVTARPELFGPAGAPADPPDSRG
jgi:hypothetical protein